MIRWMLFLHVFGVVLWLGSVLTVTIVNRKSLAHGSQDVSRAAMDATRTVVRWIATPWALIVLATGIALIVQLGYTGVTKPFWLSFMERFGGMVALLSVAVINWMMIRASRRPSAEDQVSGFRRLSWVMSSVGAMVTLTLFIVMFKVS